MSQNIEKIVLTPKEAFKAMVEFLISYHERGNGDDNLLDVLTDIQPIRNDNEPADPASWKDWLDIIRRMKVEPTSSTLMQ